MMINQRIFKVILCIFFSFFITLSQAQFILKKIHLKGKVQFLNPEDRMRKFNGYNINKVYYKHTNITKEIKQDSIEINQDGTWNIELLIDTPTFYEINIAKWDNVTVWVDDNVEINTRGYDTSKYKVKNPPYVYINGSKSNGFINIVNYMYYKHYQNLIGVSREIYFSENPFNKSWNDYLKENNYLDNVYKDFNDRILLLIEVYKDEPIVAYAFNFLNNQSKESVMIPILEKLNDKYTWFKDGKIRLTKFKEEQSRKQLLQPEMQIPNFVFSDEAGKTVTLKDFNGKYLLIDFWASWCGPCRQAIPSLIEIYNQYNSKGFEILSVSMDDKIKDWKKALLEEEMPWKQVRSLNLQETYTTFNFSSIPTLFLIDQTGKIINSYTGFTNEIERKIQSLFLNK